LFTHMNNLIPFSPIINARRKATFGAT
jgi:hypothetical protein